MGDLDDAAVASRIEPESASISTPRNGLHAVKLAKAPSLSWLRGRELVPGIARQPTNAAALACLRRVASRAPRYLAGMAASIASAKR